MEIEARPPPVIYQTDTNEPQPDLVIVKWRRGMDLMKATPGSAYILDTNTVILHEEGGDA